MLGISLSNNFTRQKHCFCA